MEKRKRRRLRKGEVGGGYKVTRVQNRVPCARASERVRGEARLRFPRCLLAARPRLSRMLLHAMLLRYTSNIKVEEGMEKRTNEGTNEWVSERPGRGKRQREREMGEERETSDGERSRRENKVEYTSRSEGLGRGWKRGTGEEAKVGPRNNHVCGALLISAFVHLRPPPRWFVKARDLSLRRTPRWLFLWIRVYSRDLWSFYGLALSWIIRRVCMNL